MRLVKLNARHWAAGLQWFQVSAKSKRDMNAVRSEGMKLKGDPPDMVAFRPRQYGFGASGGLAGYTTANPLAGGIGLPSWACSDWRTCTANPSGGCAPYGKGSSRAKATWCAPPKRKRTHRWPS